MSDIRLVVERFPYPVVDQVEATISADPLFPMTDVACPT